MNDRMTYGEFQRATAKAPGHRRVRLTVEGWRAAGATVLPGKCQHREGDEFTWLGCNADIWWVQPAQAWLDANGTVHQHRP